jgi:hypothetical protein
LRNTVFSRPAAATTVIGSHTPPKPPDKVGLECAPRLVALACDRVAALTSVLVRAA